MTVDDWAKGYFGENVDFPQAIRDAWNEASKIEREMCAEKADRELELCSNSLRDSVRDAIMRSNAI